MASLVISGAQAALAVKDGMSGASGAASGKLKGRKVTHWSYWIFLAGSAVGAIVAIAGVILGLAGIPAMYALAVVGGILCLTNAGAAFYVKRFANLKTLEGYVKQLTAKVQTMAQNVRNLNKENTRLEGLTNRVEQIPGEYEKVVDEGTAEVEKVNKELQKELKAAQLKFTKLSAAVSKGIKEQVGKLSKVSASITKSNNILGEKTKLVAQHLKEFDEQNAGFEKNLLEMDEQTDEFDALNKQFAKQVEIIGDLLGLVDDVADAATESMSGLKEENDELGAAARLLKNEMDELRGIKRAFEKMADYQDLQKDCKRYKLLCGAMKAFIKKEDGRYGEFKEEWKASQIKGE